MWDWELLKSGSSNHHYEIVSKYGNEDFQYSHAISYGSSEDEYCLHSHAMYELVCSISGDVVYLIEGHQYHMENGSLLLISPAVPHKLFICSDDPFERHSFYINFAGSNSTLSTMINQFRCVSGHDRFGSIYYEPQDVESILKDFERLSKVSSSPKESSRNLVPYLAEGLLANLIFVLDGISPLQFTKSTTKTIDQIMLYLNKNFTKSLTLQSVADSFHISKDYCNRLFKQASGMTIMQYVIYNRVLYAKKLLSEGVLATEAALMAGFSEYSNFYRAYCKITGSKPGEDKQLSDRK
mgnify:FL=1